MRKQRIFAYVTKEFQDEVSEAARSLGISISTFVLLAIKEKLKKK